MFIISAGLGLGAIGLSKSVKILSGYDRICGDEQKLYNYVFRLLTAEGELCTGTHSTSGAAQRSVRL